MRIPGKKLALTLALLTFIPLFTSGLHRHIHRHGFCRRGCSVCAALEHTKLEEARRTDNVVPSVNKSTRTVVLKSEPIRSSPYKPIFSIRPPPSGTYAEAGIVVIQS